MKAERQSVSLRDIMLAVRYGDAALVGESCGYLILGAADRAYQMPRRIGWDEVTVNSEGQVELDATPCPLVESEAGLRHLLEELLQMVRTPCPNLERVARRAGSAGLEHLVRELEAALIPVNRKAARRSLARLARDAARSARNHQHFAAVEPVPRLEVPVARDEPPQPDFIEVSDDMLEDLSASPPDVQLDVAPVEKCVEPAPPSVVAEAKQGGDAPPPQSSHGPLPRMGRAEHQTVCLIRSTHPTLPVDPRVMKALASSIGARTPSETLPQVVEVQNAPEPPVLHEPSEEPPTQIMPRVEDVDESPTQVFAPVSPVDPSPPLETPKTTRVERPGVVDAGAPSPRSSFESTRGDRGGRPAPIAPNISLIPCPGQPGNGQPGARRRSDVTELLERMSLRQESEEALLSGLKSLSKVELSPACPPVAPAWVDE